MVKRLLISLFLLALAGCNLPASPDDNEVSLGGVPAVRIAAPLANATYNEGVEVYIQVAVTNPGSDVVRVDVQVDNNLLASFEPEEASADFFNFTETWTTEGAGSHTISATAFQVDTAASAPASVTINVVASAQPTATVTDEVSPTATPTERPDTAPTELPAETVSVVETEEVITPDGPTARFENGINVRRGPGTNFVPPIGQFTANQTTEILGTNLDGSWLKVRYGSGEGWVYAPLVTVEGDISSLPAETGPATPVPAQPTAAPQPTATTAPQSQVNLVVEGHFVDPPVPDCGQNFRVGMTIRNTGTTAADTGLSVIRDVHKASGQAQQTTAGGLVSVNLAPGAGHYVEVQFNVSTYVNEVHRIEFIADVNNEIAETNEADNIQAIEYTLPANCG
jgi:uncharacterized protein YraI